MAHYKFPAFPTRMQRITNRIVTFSDIHGDIDALIVCLRDCAGVIEKPGYDSKTGRDPDLDVFLSMDINEAAYQRDLGYRWVSNESTYVVIIGDLIDAIRNRDYPIEIPPYPQLELKIIHFINAINESALLDYQTHRPSPTPHIQSFVPASCGRIYKLLGNHDIRNFSTSFSEENKSFMRNYSFPHDIPDLYGDATPYYKTFTAPLASVPGLPVADADGIYTYTRDNIFSYLAPGFQAYFETTGTGMLLIINDNLFVHGGIEMRDGKPNIIDIMDYHRRLNASCIHPISPADFYTLSFEMLNPLLQTRDYYYDNSEVEIPKDANGGGISCGQFKTRLNEFCLIDDGFDFSNECQTNPSRLRMFKGHCPQFDKEESSTLSGLISKNESLETYSNVHEGEQHEQAYYKGPRQDDKVDGHNQRWGITFSCDRNHTNGFTAERDASPQIIKVDVGMGRGQDSIPMLDTGRSEMNVLGTRVPQIMVIPTIGTEQLLLVRCTMQHMAMHLPRPFYSATRISHPGFRTQSVYGKRRKTKKRGKTMRR